MKMVAKEVTYRNRYKTNPRAKDYLIFFLMWSWFYKTFESDAIVASQFFWLKITMQEWVQTVWFLESSTNYFERLEDAGYSYVALKLQEDWNISVLRNYEWENNLDLNVPFETYQGLLNEILRIHEKYSVCLRLIQPIDLPFKTQEEWNKLKEWFISSEVKQNKKESKLTEKDKQTLL